MLYFYESGLIYSCRKLKGGKMSVKRNKIVSALLPLGLSISLLAACSQEGSAPAAIGNTNQKDKKDEPLKISMAWGLYNELPDMNNSFWKEFKKKTNVDLDIQWIPSANYQQKLELMLATGDIPEVVLGVGYNVPTFYKAIENGMFWDLTPFLGDFSKYPNLKKNKETGVFDYNRVNGKIYTLPRMRSQVHSSLLMRKDWLDNLKIPMPTTLDEYKAALQAIVKANPTGQNPIGLTTHGVLGGARDVFMPGFGVYDPTYDKDGGLIRGLLTPQYADMVEWFRGLYADGLLPKEFSTMKEPQSLDLIGSGKAASLGYVVRADWQYTESNRKIDPNALVRSAVLKGPKGYAINLRSNFAPGMFISKKVPEEKLKRILDFYESTATAEFLKFGEYGVEGIHYTMVNGYPKMTELGSKEMVISSYDPWVLTYDPGFKIRNVNAPPEFNKETESLVKDWTEKGKLDPFSYLISDTFNDIWPKYQDEFDTKTVQAIIGKISINDFRAYQEQLRNLPEMKKAFQEFTKSEKEFAANKGK
jgi:putative aldouronate transport system substrate-binding protein